MLKSNHHFILNFTPIILGNYYANFFIDLQKKYKKGK